MNESRKGRPPKLKLTAEQQEKYITAKSHARLAKEFGCKLSELVAYAQENGLDEESRLYWLDVSMERLKETIDTAEEVSASHVNALKGLLKLDMQRHPPGRPSEKDAYKKGQQDATADYAFYESVNERMKNHK